jgi:hypothetical protein
MHSQVCHRMEELHPALSRYFKASVFMRFERDHRGMVPVQLLANYFTSRSYQLHLVSAAVPATAAATQGQPCHPACVAQ